MARTGLGFFECWTLRLMGVLAIVLAMNGWVLSGIPTEREQAAQLLLINHQAVLAYQFESRSHLDRVPGSDKWIRRGSPHELWLDYSYRIGTTPYSRHLLLRDSEWEQIKAQGVLELWYAAGEPGKAKPRYVLERLAHLTPLERIHNYLRWMVPLGLLMVGIALLIWGRWYFGVTPWPWGWGRYTGWP
jgi:hypothetical protein